jgi:Fic family protein
MNWNWQKKDWGNFTYNLSKLDELENQFIYESGLMFGAFIHLDEDKKEKLLIEIISDEALKTSEIEGEYLNRDSLQSSICRQLGFKADNRKIKPAEKGISELMINLYKTYDQKLSHEVLFRWHGILMRNREDLESIGEYRKSKEPMQIISGQIGEPRIHFEAPPSKQLHKEMTNYIKWFNNNNTLKPLARAGIAHLYFECIHPFEDGNGRIGRALTEKCLAQSLGKPTLIALSTIINADKKAYYDALEKANKSNEITPWLLYFSKTILESIRHSKSKIEALITKAKLFSKLDGQLNDRQIKVLNKMFDAEPKGFEGGMSAAKYMSITGATIPTTTRDLADLVKKKALKKKGELKHSRYYLFSIKKNN